MKLTFESKLELPNARELMDSKGFGNGGHVQQQFVRMAMRRMEKYMPARQGSYNLIKKMNAYTDPSAGLIVVPGPEARYLYHGKVMVDAKTGKGPAHIPDVGYRFRKGATLKPTSRDLTYDESQNSWAGPYWDRRMMEEEGKALAADLQAYVDRKGAGT